MYSLANVLAFIGATATEVMNVTSSGLVKCSHYVSLFRNQFICLLLVLLQTGRGNFLFDNFKNSVKMGGKILWWGKLNLPSVEKTVANFMGSVKWL